MSTADRSAIWPVPRRGGRNSDSIGKRLVKSMDRSQGGREPALERCFSAQDGDAYLRRRWLTLLAEGLIRKGHYEEKDKNRHQRPHYFHASVTGGGHPPARPSPNSEGGDHDDALY